MTQQLPSLQTQDRPALARLLWRALADSANRADAPQMELGRALALHRLYPPKTFGSRVSDVGWLHETAIGPLVSQLWPAIASSEHGHIDEADQVERHGYQFRQRISQYLRGTGNAVCVRPGNRVVASRWWIRTDWFECAPRAVKLQPYGSEVPDLPEAEFLRLQDENQLLRRKVEELTQKVARLNAMLRATGE